MPLTESRIRTLKPKDRRYKVADSYGLFIEVMPSGKKYWRLFCRVNGKQRQKSIGVFPIVKLVDARHVRDGVKRELYLGNDPDEGDHSAKLEPGPKKETWKAVCHEFLQKIKKEGRSPLTNRNTARYLERTWPYLGAKEISEIEPLELLEVLRIEEEAGRFENASRIRSTCSRVARYAISCGYLKQDFAAALVGALVAPVPKSLAAITEPDEVGQLMRAIHGYQGQFLTKSGLLLTAHTWLRSSELRFATWDQIDWGNCQWVVPAENMKMKRKHVVPLSTQSVKFLEQLYSLTAHKGHLIFPSKHKTGRVMSENTLGNALKSMGYDGTRHVPHGFRTMASTNINEMGWNRDWIEKQLAHEDSSVRGVYNAAEYLDGRRGMMQAYSDWLDERAADIPVAHGTH